MERNTRNIQCFNTSVRCCLIDRSNNFAITSLITVALPGRNATDAWHIHYPRSIHDEDGTKFILSHYNKDKDTIFYKQLVGQDPIFKESKNDG